MDAPVLRSTANIGDAGISVSGGATYTNAQYTGAGGTLSAAVQGYWGSTSDISIYGYAPYQASAPTSVSVKTDQSADTDYAASDFLYASPKTFTFANRNNISLTFDHHLSRINLTLVAGDGVSATELATATVQLTNTSTEATITIANGELSELSAIAAIIPSGDGTNKYKAIVIPQTVAIGTSLFEVSIGARSFGYTLPVAQSFDKGKQYNYTLTISQGGITVSPVAITKWKEDVKDASGTGHSIYRVGDYYPSPNDANTAIGLVFWIDPAGGGRHGKMVSLNEMSLAWGEGVTTNTTSTSDGKANMTAIKDIADWATKYPAFKWCADKGTGWYLPAKNELQHLYCAYNGVAPIAWDLGAIGAPATNQNARTAFNGKLSAAVGTSISANWYWSSSEFVNFNAWIVYFFDGTTNFDLKNYYFSVRAVSAF